VETKEMLQGDTVTIRSMKNARGHPTMDDTV
jgi:hypothetical protein